MGNPSNRWPWIAIAAGVVIIVLAVVIFFVNRPSNQVTINVGTPSAVGAVSSPSPPPTLVPPTLPASASPLAASSPAPPPSPTPSPVPTQAPTPSPLPPPSPPPVVAAPPPAAGQPTAPQPGGAAQASPVPGTTGATPGAAAPGTAPAPGAAAGTGATPGAAAGTGPTPGAAAGTGATPGAATAGVPSPTPFAGQVSAGGGLGNTRTDIEAAYGAPLGQTSNGLVVFRKNNFEYHVGLVPDLNGRASLILEQPVQTGQLPALQQAQAEAHRLLPTDAQPPNPTPEGNEQFVVERFTSQKLAQALPTNVFSPGGGQPGSFLIVYVRDQQTGNIARWILGAGNDPNALIAEAGS